MKGVGIVGPGTEDSTVQLSPFLKSLPLWPLNPVAEFPPPKLRMHPQKGRTYVGILVVWFE